MSVENMANENYLGRMDIIPALNELIFREKKIIEKFKKKIKSITVSLSRKHIF